MLVKVENIWLNLQTVHSITQEEIENHVSKLTNVTLVTASHTKYSPFHIKIENFNSYAGFILTTVYCI